MERRCLCPDQATLERACPETPGLCEVEFERAKERIAKMTEEAIVLLSRV